MSSFHQYRHVPTQELSRVPKSVIKSSKSAWTDRSDSDFYERTFSSLQGSFLQSSLWRSGVFLLIFLNTLAMGIESNYPYWSGWLAVNSVFMILFVIEISVRLIVLRDDFFSATDRRECFWNTFDLTIISFGATYIIKAWICHEPDFPVFLMRAFRIVRVLQTLRLMQQFEELNLLLLGLIDAMWAAMWMTFLFAFIIFICSIFTTNLIGHNAQRWGDQASEIEELFGTLPVSFFTMFAMVTLDDWSTMVRLVQKGMPGMVPFFILYTLVTAFAMMAVMSGMMVDAIIAVDRKLEYEEDTVRAFSSLKRHFDGDVRSCDEVVQLLSNPQLANATGMGLKKDEISQVMHDIGVDGDDGVDWNELRDALYHFQKSSSRKLLFALRIQLDRMLKEHAAQ